MNGCGRSRFAPGLVAGIVLTALGSLFVLDSFGVLDAGNLLDYWPLFLILPGIAHMLWPRKHADRFWGAILAGIGTPAPAAQPQRLLDQLPPRVAGRARRAGRVPGVAGEGPAAR
jgi:hypothetical protein